MRNKQNLYFTIKNKNKHLILIIISFIVCTIFNIILYEIIDNLKPIPLIFLITIFIFHILLLIIYFKEKFIFIDDLYINYKLFKKEIIKIQDINYVDIKIDSILNQYIMIFYDNNLNKKVIIKRNDIFENGYILQSFKKNNIKYKYSINNYSSYNIYDKTVIDNNKIINLNINYSYNNISFNNSNIRIKSFLNKEKTINYESIEIVYIKEPLVSFSTQMNKTYSNVFYFTFILNNNNPVYFNIVLEGNYYNQILKLFDDLKINHIIKKYNNELSSD